MGINSNKLQSPIYAERVYNKVLITSTYNLTNAWANSTGWTLTIPETGKYKIKASGSIVISESTSQVWNNYTTYIRLAVGGVAITGTARRYYISSGSPATYVGISSIFELTWEDDFTAGDVVTLQSTELTGGANECTLLYGAGVIEPYMSYELVQQTIPVRDISGDYSTTETDTGKNWIDGKRIYRKVINFGAMPSTATKYIAHGIVTIDNVMPGFPCGVAKSGTVFYPITQARVATANNITISVTGANVGVETGTSWAGWTAFVVLEYTKV